MGRWKTGMLASMVAALLPTLFLHGCGVDARDALNPAFVDFLGPEVIGSPSGPTSSGHVVVALRNDTRFDEQLLSFLVDRGLDESILEDEDLRPRIRMLVRITFVNDETLLVELSDGSARVVDPAFDVDNLPELQRTVKDNIVVQCDVSRVELVGLPSVFVPTFLTTVSIVTTDLFQQRRDVVFADPRFVQLAVDQVDELGNPVIFRNLDVRDQPAPAVGPNCGSVVTLTMTGTLRVNFTTTEFGFILPGFLDTDIESQEALPGRFRITVGIR